MYLLLKRSPSGIAKGWPPFAGVAGVSPASSPLRAACGGAQKREKECFGDTPITCASSSPYYLPPRQGGAPPGRVPGRGRLPSALPLLEPLLSKFRMTHVEKYE